MQHQIKRINGTVLFECEVPEGIENPVRFVIETAVKQGVSLAGARLEGVNLSCVDFAGVNLTGASFFFSNVAGANFAGANLQKSSLIGANCEGANFVGANLQNADCFKVNFSGANFEKPSIKYDLLTKHYGNQRFKQLREILCAKYGARKFKITASQDVHVYGVMPNTNQTGWFFIGSVLYVMRDFNII